MMTNEQEVLEFSMLYGSVGESQTNEEGREIVFDLPRYFECVAAIREKDAKLIEMLKNSVKRVLISFGSENDCPAIGYIEPMALDFVGTGSFSAGERAEKDFYRTVIQPCEHALSATQATAEAFRAEVEAKMQLPPVLAEVMGERQRQDGKWGGPATDDQYNALDWHEMIADYNGWARRMAAMGSPDKARRRYIQVAALAVAAVEALDRAAEKRKQAEQLTNKEKEA